MTELFDSQTEFLARRWESFQTATKWEKRLAEQLTSALGSLETNLREEDWWTNQWEFVRYKPQQVYISHADWALDEEERGLRHRVWIGIEEFGANYILGDEGPPSLYVWAPRRLGDALVDRLRETLRLEGRLKGNPGRTPYIASNVLGPISGRSLGEYFEYVRTECIAWFSHYARQKALIDQILAKV